MRPTDPRLSDPSVTHISLRLASRVLGMRRPQVRRWARDAGILTPEGISKRLLCDRFPEAYRDMLEAMGDDDE